MRNAFYFQFDVTDEQTAYAKSLVEYSLENHKVPNIWSKTAHENRTAELRLTGTLGEVVFADAYRLTRPSRSFGAADGQDLGRDFVVKTADGVKSFDIKTMRRITNKFFDNYILNIPHSQILKPNSLTDFYFHVSLHQNPTGKFIATFVGYVRKDEVVRGEIGTLFKAGTTRTRANGTTFDFTTDTYEVLLQDFTTPLVNKYIKNLSGYSEKKIMQI